MDTKHLVGLLGGPSKIMEDTGLSKGRVSQWVSEDRITPSWLKFYRLKHPDIDWSAYDAHLAGKSEVGIEETEAAQVSP